MWVLLRTNYKSKESKQFNPNFSSIQTVFQGNDCGLLVRAKTIFHNVLVQLNTFIFTLRRNHFEFCDVHNNLIEAPYVTFEFVIGLVT